MYHHSLSGVKVFRSSILVMLLLLLGCSPNSLSNLSEDEPITLEVYMNLPLTDDGYYLFDYPNDRPHSYTSVQYKSAPMERVFWYSDDFYCVYWMWDTICEPIINYSTYTAEDSSGKQMIYIYPPHIGDTLSVWGCATDVCDGVYFIVTE